MILYFFYSSSSPISSVGDLRIDKNTYTASLCTAGSTAAISTSADTLSSMNSGIETHIAKKIDSNNFVYFHYSTGDSVVVESTTEFGSFQTILSGNFVEHYDPTTSTGIQYKFKEVVSVDIVDEFLFVLDKGNLTLFKFDISGLITNDTVVRRKNLKDVQHPGRFLLKTLGGTEYTQVKNRLVDPVAISIHDKLIYILDNGTRSIKIYDLNFNYIKDIITKIIFILKTIHMPKWRKFISSSKRPLRSHHQFKYFFMNLRWKKIINNLYQNPLTFSNHYTFDHIAYPHEI